MKLPMPSLRWHLLALVAALLPAGATKTREESATACDCSDSLASDVVAFGISLLQNDAQDGKAKRPRDCTCITGVKSYQTTPKDQLLGMPMLALAGHLDSCERKLEGLEQQRDYAVAESEVKIKKAQKQTGRVKTSLEKIRKRSANDRSDDKKEKKELMQEVHTLEKQVTELNSQYDKEFSTWWKLKDSMTAKLKTTKTCNCKKAMLLQNLRGPPPSKDKYDYARKVEECETKVIKIEKEIEKYQKAGRDATINDIEHRDQLGKAMVDQARLDKLLSVKDHLEALTKTKRNLEAIVRARQQKVDKYKSTNADIRKELNQLDTDMKKCSC
jgi:DNA repair exonuclease SbcCD ATPase subunit